MAQVYVSTWKKYNEGNLTGQWIDLNNLNTYRDFLAKCSEIHKDEKDPEFMIQATDDMPDGLNCGEWMSEKEFFDIKEALKDEQDEQCAKFEIINYSEKAIAVIGDTKEIKEELKKLGGRFNPRLSCGAGWIFSKKIENELKSFLSCGKVTTSQGERKQKNNDLALIDEYLNEWRKIWKDNARMMEYGEKKTSAIRKLSNGGLLTWEKPRIETSFCFGYRGSDDEDANRMVSHAKTNEGYFKSENLKGFDHIIKKIESLGSDEDYSGNKLYIYREKYSRTDNLNLWSYTILPFWQYNEAIERNLYLDIQEANEEDINTILEAEKNERAKFEKRLNAYLKKYGLSKVRSWSYWQDA